MIKILNYDINKPEDIMTRATVVVPEVESIVSGIIEDVRSRGDAALFEYCEKFDKAKLTSLRVSEDEIKAGVEIAGAEFVGVLERAAANIRDYHTRQKRQGFTVTEREGCVLGQRITALERAGLYIPGGTASYPSSVLMSAIPAAIAGVEDIVMVTPPAADGSVKPEILAAAHVAGVTEIYKLGGAQAVAALAYGTQSVKRVDKIVGPGNIFVATAKRQVFGVVDIDMMAGPSEILVIADNSSDPAVVAADLLSQAEHDKLATAVLICTDRALADAVSKELERQIPLLTRSDIARESIDTNGKIIIAESLKQAVEASNIIAPEHLVLFVDDPFGLLPSVKNAGSIFLGKNTPEALGDYYAGPNHTLPTSGTARFSSPLSVDDFIKKTSYLYYTKEALSAVRSDVVTFAESEGFTAHGRSVSIRFGECE